MSTPPALRIAGRLAGHYPLAGTYHEARFASQAPDLVARASALVEAETGLRGGGFPEVRVVSRQEWAAINIDSFSHLMESATAKLESTMGRKVGRRLMGVELGAVLGLLSRRVLGQYELVLPSSDGSFGDTVLFVGANILWMERQHEFRPDEFRFWVALHECTHRLQFVGIPWLRDYFLSLVDELVQSAKPEQGRVGRVAAELKAAADAGEPLIDERGLLGLFASPEQRDVIDRVQALMSLLEGHGHVVMDRIGARHLVTQRRMSEVLKARRADPRTAQFFRLVGLEMKMLQYEMGAKFIEGVERHAGWDVLAAAWERPESLPDLDEIANPVAWLNRVA